MKGRLFGVLLGALLLVSMIAGPASARQDRTITVSCTIGGVTSFLHLTDIHSTSGQVTVNSVFNMVNPFGEICTVLP
jgi:hypothetical protein